MEIDVITREIIGAAIEVHKRLGPGLLERTYEECLIVEFEERNLNYERQKSLEIKYKNKVVKNAFRIDLLVENQVIVELKAIEKTEKIHKSQLLTYLKLSNKKVGLLINFNVKALKEGITRVIN